jgi:hypothetical protein
VAADGFRLLLPDEPPVDDEAGRVAGIDEDPDREVDEKRDDEHPCRLEIARQPRIHEGDDGEREQDACTGPHDTFVQNPDAVAVELLAEVEDTAHAGSFLDPARQAPARMALQT